MEALKEYAGVITAVVSVMAALGALGLWAINVQVTPEINRLEERIDARFDRVESDINDRFNRVEGEIKTIRNDIKTILLRLPAPAETG